MGENKYLQCILAKDYLYLFLKLRFTQNQNIVRSIPKKLSCILCKCLNWGYTLE